MDVHEIFCGRPSWTNRFDFGTDPGLDLNAVSIFLLYQHNEIGHFMTLLQITEKLVDECS